MGCCSCAGGWGAQAAATGGRLLPASTARRKGLQCAAGVLLLLGSLGAGPSVWEVLSSKPGLVSPVVRSPQTVKPLSLVPPAPTSSLLTGRRTPASVQMAVVFFVVGLRVQVQTSAPATKVLD